MEKEEEDEKEREELLRKQKEMEERRQKSKQNDHFDEIFKEINDLDFGGSREKRGEEGS